MTLTQIASIIGLLLAFNVPTTTVQKVEAILQPKVATTTAFISQNNLNVKSYLPIEETTLSYYDCDKKLVATSSLNKLIVRQTNYTYGYQFLKPLTEEVDVRYTTCSLQLTLMPLIGESELRSQLFKLNDLPINLTFTH